MTKYRKRPVVVEAWRYGSHEQKPDWLYEAFDKNIIRPSVNHDYLFIDTLEGTHRANKGDYIIQGVHGELYPCKPHIFEKTYELCEGEVEPEYDDHIFLRRKFVL